MLTKSIFDIFIKHDTLLHPDAVKHIEDQEDPMKYVNSLVENITNLPMVLTLKDIKNIENDNILQFGKPDDSKISKEIENDDIKPPKSFLENKAPGKSSKQLSSAFNQNDEEYGKDESLDKFAIAAMSSGGLMKAGIGAVGAVQEITGDNVEVSQFTEKNALTPTGKEPVLYDIKIISDITGKSTCEGTMKDFGRYVNNRFNTLKNVIRSQYRIFSRSAAIEKINVNYVRDVHFIGMITDINTTKKGNLLVDIEDETGEVKVFINKDEPQLRLKLLNDEVIGISGETNPKLGMVMAKRITRPMPPRTRYVNRAAEDIEAVFISDIHVGSREFLEKNWEFFIQWLNGDVELHGKISSDKVRYLVVAGDLVDGIGVYPNQQEELAIADIYEQYKTLAEHLSAIRKDIKVILAPGNHDAVRPAEPQPALGEEFQKFFSKETIFVGNPCFLSLHSVDVLVYHGRSFDDIVKYIPEATYTNPITPMKEMMIRRHLVPIWGERTPIAPEHRDSLIIDRLPDIFVTGHVHTAGCERINDMLFINASSWQDQTSYQKTLNFNPDPCKAYLVNLHTVRGTELNFKIPNF